MTVLLVGTDDGLYTLDIGHVATLRGSSVTSLVRDDAAWWAIADGRTLWRRERNKTWEQYGSIVGDDARCLVPVPGGLLVGTAGAHMVKIEGRALRLLESFDRVEGRKKWFTPWGGPPDTRSLATDGATVYANVHVGGILRSRDAGESWQPTPLDLHADVHEVVVQRQTGLVLAASALGLMTSHDGGDTWTVVTDGLHATYLRAVAVGNGTVLVSASDGPGGERSAVYSRPVGSAAPFVRCDEGLSGWLGDNVDSGCLAASGRVAAFGTPDGRVFISTDSGRVWKPASRGLPPVRCVRIE